VSVDDRPTAKYATAPDGVSLCYRVTGEGSPDLVWLVSQSFPFDLLWDEPSFLRLARRMDRFSRSLWPELRGIGPSGGRYLDNWTLAGVANDVTALVDAAGFGSFVLVGDGVVSPWAIHYAAAHPERLEALILIDAYAHYLRGPNYPVGFTPETLDHAIALTRERWGSGNPLYLARSRVNDSAFTERLARCERLGVSPEDGATMYRRSVTIDTRSELPNIAVPTLVLHRAGDPLVRSEAGRYLADHIPGAKYVELPGEDHLFYVGDVDALVDEIEQFLTGSHQGAEGDLVTATILFTDIVSSTKQAAEMGHRKWTTLTEAHDSMIRAALQQRRGREVKTLGDGFLAVFDSTSQAVRAAVEIVTVASDIGLEVRAGVHAGEVELRPEDVVGLSVNVAKRICDLAGPGEALVSETVPRLVTGSPFEFLDRGEYELKGVPGTWKLFAVRG
jgi:class 3 adenylate cyclase